MEYDGKIIPNKNGFCCLFSALKMPSFWPFWLRSFFFFFFLVQNDEIHRIDGIAKIHDIHEMGTRILENNINDGAVL